MTAKEIWNKDKQKIDFIIEKGFKVLVAWECDYNNNKEEIINNCIKFLRN